jgi:hypothetical protein
MSVAIGYDSPLYVLPFDLRPMGLGKRPPTQESRTSRVGLIDDQAPSNVEAGCSQPEREREQGEHGRHHLADEWRIPLLLTTTPILLHPEADLERQEDERHSGQDDAPDREEIERSSVGHTVPDPATRGKSSGHHLKHMVLPFAEIEE